MPENRTAHRVSRRGFIKASAGTAASLLILQGSAASTRANSKLRIGIVGVANRARANLNAVSGEHIAALCDVDANFLRDAASSFKDAKLFRDYREMIAQVPLDAIVVSTPDHMHAPAAALGMRSGLHAYVEKPLARTVYECRTLERLADTKGLVTQMGTQIHAGENYRRVVELVQGGAIGTVREVHVWCGKSWSGGRYGPAKEPPKNLDWNQWLGPRPAHAYSDGIHPANWRKFWDYGTGTLGDMACHYIDLVFWALSLEYPTRVQAWGPEVHEVGTPQSLKVRWDFPRPGIGQRDMIALWWYDGGPRPEIVKGLKHADGSPIQWGDGHLFVGDKGMILSDYSRYLLLPEDKFAEFTPPPPSIARSIGHHAEWIQAIKDGGKTTCNFGYSGKLAQAVVLGNVAFRAGGEIAWDGANGRVLGNAAAQRLIVPSFRAGFEV
jgi:predicted dehydrogenase